MTIREEMRATIDPAASHQALAMHRVLLRAALAATTAFAWLFVFVYFYAASGDIAAALARVALLYALAQVCALLLTPLSAGLLAAGARRVLADATLFAAAAFAILAATLSGMWGPGDAPYGFVAFALLLGAYRAFYWLPYEAETHGSGAPSRSVWREVGIALMPLVAGLCLATDGSARVWLLCASSLLLVAAIFPLTRVREVRERFPWSYRHTFGEVFAPEHRELLWRTMGEGALGAALLFLWPLSAFLILGWSFGMLGIVLSLTLLVVILARGTVRRSMRRMGLHRSELVGSLLALSPWILRLGVASPLGILLIDAYFYTTTPRQLGMDPFTFDQAGDAGYLLDEYTALKEIGMALGRLAMAALAAALALAFSVPVAFVGCFFIAGLLSIWFAQ